MFDTWSELETLAWDAGDTWTHHIHHHVIRTNLYTRCPSITSCFQCGICVFLIDWLNSIGTKTDRFVPQICLSMPSTLAQLPTHRTSSSPIWLQLKSRRMMVWLMQTASAKTWNKCKQSVKRMTRGAKHHKLLPFWLVSFWWNSITPVTFEAALFSLKNFAEHKSLITVSPQVPYSQTMVDTFREIPNPKYTNDWQAVPTLCPNPVCESSSMAKGHTICNIQTYNGIAALLLVFNIFTKYSWSITYTYSI